MIYLDTSALIKLVGVEAGSDDLADWLDQRIEMPWFTSTLAEVELPRAVIRTGQLDRLAAVPAVLARLDLFEIDDVVRTTAAAYQDPYLRSLDAIHLATASVAASIATLAALVTYDSRLATIPARSKEGTIPSRVVNRADMARHGKGVRATMFLQLTEHLLPALLINTDAVIEAPDGLDPGEHGGLPTRTRHAASSSHSVWWRSCSLISQPKMRSVQLRD